MSQVLREYQVAALDRTRAEYRAGAKSVLLVAPTGAGKTTIARAASSNSIRLGGRVLFLAHRRELIDQASQRLGGLPHGIILSGRESDPAAPIQVASVQTLARREPPPASLIIVDEAHRSPAASYAEVLARYPEAKVLGLTATPWRLDGRGLADLFQASVLVATPRQLIAEGYLCPYSGFAYDSPNLRGIGRRGGDFATRGLELVMGRAGLLGNVVRAWVEHASALPTVVFACSRAHSRDLAERFQQAGVRAEHVDGDMPTAERDAIVARFRAGTTQLLTNVAILSEGFDLAELACVVLARPTLSTALFLQQVGRALRPGPGKVARIHDHARCVEVHGLPDDERDYSLRATVKARLPKSDAVTALRTCPACYAVFPDARNCPACGEAMQARPRPVREVEAEQVALEEAAARGRAREMKSTQGLAELIRLGRQHGYKPGWALMRFRSRWGRYPTRAERSAAYDLATVAVPVSQGAA